MKNKVNIRDINTPTMNFISYLALFSLVLLILSLILKSLTISIIGVILFLICGHSATKEQEKFKIKEAIPPILTPEEIEEDRLLDMLKEKMKEKPKGQYLNQAPPVSIKRERDETNNTTVIYIDRPSNNNFDRYMGKMDELIRSNNKQSKKKDNCKPTRRSDAWYDNHTNNVDYRPNR
jgi:hypothetical protein